MKHTIRNVALTALAVTTFLTTAHAQREVLAPEQIAASARDLPASIQATQPASFKAYLQSLQKQPASRQVANAVRVAQDARAANLPANSFFGYYSVPAMSEEMRLPDAYPLDGQFGGAVVTVLAQDAYETASFVVYPFADAAQVNLKVSDLKSTDGSTLPAANVDLKVVKVWYQNGNGWFSYFQDVGLELVPELLVHDENLIRVDTKEKANYARINGPKGASEVWISAPRKLDVGFNPYQDGFADAKTLQPVAFAAGQFKQFVLTAHATADTKPGVYRGQIAVTTAGQTTTQIPVTIRVLPFQLPLPKTNYDINKNFLVTLMGAWPHVGPENKAFLPTLKDLRQHNILNLAPNVGPSTPPAQTEAAVKAMKEAGFQTDFIFGGNLPWLGGHGGDPLTFDEMMQFKSASIAWREFYDKQFGKDTQAAVGLGDEQGTGWVMKTRPAWRAAQEQGLQTNLAGHLGAYYPKAGYILDVRPTAGAPADTAIPRMWNQIGHGHTGFYANQHTGPENPAFVRRQHGLLGYLSGYDMVDNYEFAYGPWNDRATELYKPMVLAYPISEGLVDTLEWEGFREGIDDIRYATKLRQLADAAIATGNLNTVYEGRKVRQWFAELDGERADMSTVRLEMIAKIEHLMQLGITVK